MRDRTSVPCRKRLKDIILLQNDENVRSEAAIMLTHESCADDKPLLRLPSAYMLSPMP